MSIHRVIGEPVALGLALILSSNVALAQSRNPQKRPTIGGKPIVQVKPSAPIGCKLGRVLINPARWSCFADDASIRQRVNCHVAAKSWVGQQPTTQKARQGRAAVKPV